MNVNLLGRGFWIEVVKLALLAAVLTGLLNFLPTYSEAELWGKFLNNFLYLVVFYLAVRWSAMLYAGVRRR